MNLANRALLFLPWCSIYPDRVNTRTAGLSANYVALVVMFKFCDFSLAIRVVTFRVQMPWNGFLSWSLPLCRVCTPAQESQIPWRTSCCHSKSCWFGDEASCPALLVSEETSASPQPLLRKLHLGEARFAFLLSPL